MLLAFFKRFSKYFNQSSIGKNYEKLKLFINNINPYFSVHLLFAWAIFKAAFFFKFSFQLRLMLGFISFLLLFFFWDKILPRVFNNFLFQLLLFFFFFLINLFQSNSIRLGFIGFIFGSFSLFWFNTNQFFSLGKFFFFIPDWEYFLLLLICFSFFRRFNSTIIIPEIIKGIPLEHFEVGYLHWNTLIFFLNRHFKHQFSITNKLYLKFFNYPFYFFPVEKKFLDLLSLYLNETKTVIILLMEEELKKGSSTSDNFVESFKKEYRKIETKSDKVIFEASLWSSEQNNIIFFEILEGLIFSFFFLFFFFNIA